jgi:DNA-binding transcriptional LysR family regulator
MIEILRSVELRLHSDLSLEIVSAYSLELIALLQQHELDLALVTSPPPNAQITSVRVATNPFMIALHKEHALAEKTSIRLEELVPYPWIFFNRSVHYHLHDLILKRIKKWGAIAIRHSVTHEEQIAVLLTDDHVIAWLTPTGTERVASSGLKFVPLLDPHIRLDIHLASLANNKSPLVSEYARGFMKRFAEERTPTRNFRTRTAAERFGNLASIEDRELSEN